jgi:hypothetical protein
VKHAYAIINLQTMRVATLTLTLLVGVVTAVAQGTPASTETLSGKYEGPAKAAAVADVQVTLELKNEGGKLSGRLVNGQTTVEVSDGNLSEGKLSLKFGSEAKDGVLTGRVVGEMITGEWLAGDQKRTIELKKVSAAAVPVATVVNLTGQWDGMADAGQPFPFLLTLKVDGEKVTGSSSSQLGEAAISSGSWKDGRLSFQLDGSNGAIVMSATVIEGKLSGEFDYSGQLQGKWVAIKKN